MSEAFKTIDQYVLVTDLFDLGIDGTVSEWFKTYINNRKLCACVNDPLSNELLMKIGVSQGFIYMFHIIPYLYC